MQPRNPYRNYYYSTRRANSRAVMSSVPQRLPLQQRTPAQQTEHSHWLRRTTGLALIALVIMAGVHIGLAKRTSAHGALQSIRLHTASAATSNTIHSLDSQLSAILQQNSNVDMSVVITDLGNNHAQHFGDRSAFTAASETKLITAADFLHEVETGKQSLTETNNGSSAQYELQQMVVISDDTAWEALNNRLSYSAIQTYAASIGLTSYKAQTNSDTSDDIALLLQKLYDGNLLNDTDTSLLLSWMKQANYRQYIVPAVPTGDTIYHKVGLYQDNVNDAAIITNGHQALVLVIFTNGGGTYDWTARAQMMQHITTEVLNTYFTK